MPGAKWADAFTSGSPAQSICNARSEKPRRIKVAVARCPRSTSSSAYRVHLVAEGLSLMAIEITAFGTTNSKAHAPAWPTGISGLARRFFGLGRLVVLGGRVALGGRFERLRRIGLHRGDADGVARLLRDGRAGLARRRSRSTVLDRDRADQSQLGPNLRVGRRRGQVREDLAQRLAIGEGGETLLGNVEHVDPGDVVIDQHFGQWLQHVRSYADPQVGPGGDRADLDAGRPLDPRRRGG